MKNRIMPTALATISLLALTSIFSYSQNPVRSSAIASTFDFHSPQNMGSTVNSESNDNGPFAAPNGLSLYFSAQADIWVCQRLTLTSAWGPPQNLTILNTADVENRPKLSLDGRTMFFNSNRGGGAQDIYVSTRTDPNNDFGWTDPVNLGANINTADTEVGAALYEDPVTGSATLYFASNRVGGLGDFDIYQSTRNSNGSFNPAVNCRVLNSPGRDSMAFPSRDGLEIYLNSDNGGLGLLDIWVARRGPSGRWQHPVNVSTVNSEYDETEPSLSPDGAVLYFSSAREGGSGSGDLYTATRLCTSGK